VRGRPRPAAGTAAGDVATVADVSRGAGFQPGGLGAISPGHRPG
jgi:hypothetical protein